MLRYIFIKIHCFVLITSLVSLSSSAQHDHQHPVSPKVNIEPQPFIAHALRLDEALKYLGSSLSSDDSRLLKEMEQMNQPDAVDKIQNILDPYCIAVVEINPEGRVKVDQGSAIANLIQSGWRSFLVKVYNNAGVTAQLDVESKNSKWPVQPSTYKAVVPKENIISVGEAQNRFVELKMYRQRPLKPQLSGLKLEYVVVQIYCKEKGSREIEIGFNIGQGSQDIGFRNKIDILFNVKPAVKVILDVKDSEGAPTMASFVITDGKERIIDDTVQRIKYRNFLESRAMFQFGRRSMELKGIHPLPSRRVALTDTYPDFFFHPQVYRADGEHVFLSPGHYTVSYTKGPEYLKQTRELTIPENVDSIKESFKLKRWIDVNKRGWFSGDHHIHASGCAHYESPEEGVSPEAMFRQVEGEGLNVGAVLTWGPSWYYQKKFFTGRTHPISNAENVIRYDVEVSGFPSSHAGHIVLLDLKNDDYPDADSIEQWPAWTLPILKWGKSQGGFVGYAHSGWGLEPVTPTKLLPNYAMPKMDGVGANEYVVSVTQNAVDFYSAGDTPPTWELNMWYHTLNCGFRVPLSGETDFPCIYGERVGMARSYFKSKKGVNFEQYIEALKRGQSYISDGRSHILDFSANGREVGTENSEVIASGPQLFQISANVAAYLDNVQDSAGKQIASTPLDKAPYWDIERSRIAGSRKVCVELIVNGESVDTTEITADGTFNTVRFAHRLQHSSWIALRVFPSSHSNPIYVTINKKPVAVTKSAKWCLESVEKCWEMKHGNFKSHELSAARAAYDNAKKIYSEIIVQGDKIHR